MSPDSRVLILGANGQLGVELQRVFAQHGSVIAMGRDRCDLANLDQLRSTIADVRPEIILNAAAYTAVDRAESEPDLAMRINGEAPGVLAEEARKISALLVHYSTDYVFDGSKALPWVEDDPTGPLNIYGSTKLAGERSIEAVGGNYLIFRTSWVFSPHGQNFLRTMLRLGAERDQLKIVNDQHGAPTSAAAIASATHKVLNTLPSNDPNGPSGIYHMTCAGETTWYGFAEAIFQNALCPEKRPWANVAGIPSSEYPTPAARPKNSVLAIGKLRGAFGVSLPPWQDALHETLQALGLADISSSRRVGRLQGVTGAAEPQ